MTDSGASLLHPRFVADLRRALNHLYDPDALRRNQLFTALDALDHGSPSLFREALIRIIADLKPRPGLSPDSDAWRVYRTLHHRFVEQFTQSETAATLGVSIRQVRRQEAQALRVMADLLWTHHDLQAHYAGIAAEPADDELEDEDVSDAEPEATAPLAQELAWLGRSLLPESASLAELVEATLLTAEPLLRELRVRADWRLPDDLPGVLVQAGPIRQAMLTILQEAIRMTPGGQIVLEADAEADQVVLTVRSIAPGPTQVDPRLDKLAVARQIAELSGSRLDTIISAADAPFVAHLHLRAVAQAAVLFIEDNPDTLQLYARYLAGAPYRCLSATTREQLAACLRETTPEVVVVDVMLSGMDGWEVLGDLRALPRMQDVPVLMCSILPLEQLALSLGAAAFLQKPVSREVLLATLARYSGAREKGPCPAP